MKTHDENSEVLYSSFSIEDGRKAFCTWLHQDGIEPGIIATFIETGVNSGLYIRDDSRFNMECSSGN